MEPKYPFILFRKV